VKELALAALEILAFARGTFKHPPKKFLDFFLTGWETASGEQRAASGGKERMANGEWRMVEKSEWRMANGEWWKRANGEWRMANG
jgi:hypothetical protein